MASASLAGLTGTVSDPFRSGPVCGCIPRKRRDAAANSLKPRVVYHAANGKSFVYLTNSDGVLSSIFAPITFASVT